VVFADRRDAGRVLAEKLVAYEGRDDLIVLGLPRGGVVVAFEVAKALRAPLDVYMVRKLGVPGQEELAFGAVASGGVRVLNDDVVRTARLDQSEIDAVTVREQAELERRERLYRGDRPALRTARQDGHPRGRWAGHGGQHAHRDTVSRKPPARMDHHGRSDRPSSHLP